MSKKQMRVAFWILTGPLALLTAMSGAMMLTHNPQAVEGFHHLGYPEYFLTYLGLAKILGVTVIIFRRFPVLTEWAYAGLTFTYIAASYSHFSSGDPMSMVVPPVVFLAILFGSRHLGKLAFMGR